MAEPLFYFYLIADFDRSVKWFHVALFSDGDVPNKIILSRKNQNYPPK